MISNDDAIVIGTGSSMLDQFTRFMLDKMKGMETPWSKLSAAERQKIVDGLHWSAMDLIREATETIAANGRRIITGSMKQVAIKDEITATITCARSSEACAAFGMASGGGPVAFLLLDTESYLQSINPVRVGPAQLEMQLDGDPVQDHADPEQIANEDSAAAFLGVTPVEISDTECPL